MRVDWREIKAFCLSKISYLIDKSRCTWSGKSWNPENLSCLGWWRQNSLISCTYTQCHFYLRANRWVIIKSNYKRKYILLKVFVQFGSPRIIFFTKKSPTSKFFHAPYKIRKSSSFSFENVLARIQNCRVLLHYKIKKMQFIIRQ